MDNLQIPTTFLEFIRFAGTAMFAAFFVSEILEHLTFFQNFSEQGKSLFVGAIYIVLGLASAILSHWMIDPTAPVTADFIYQAIAGALVAFSGGQYYHSKVHLTSGT